jgi:site-specific recombinase XerD
VTLRAGFRRDQIRRGLAARSIEERERVLNSFASWLGRPINEATTDDVNEWLDSRALTPRSRTNYLSALHCFYTWCVDEEHVSTDPTTRIRRPNLPRCVPRPINDDDLLYAISAAPPRMRAFLCLAAFNGFRCKEIASLRREDVMDRARTPLLRVSSGKGGHQAILPLNPAVVEALRLYGMPAKGFVFTKTDGTPLRPSSVSKVGNAYLHELGITATMHQLRHWFGTAVWALTKDMRVTQEMMRHSHPGTTAGYAAFDPELAAQAVTHVHELGAIPTRLGEASDPAADEGGRSTFRERLSRAAGVLSPQAWPTAPAG